MTRLPAQSVVGFIFMMSMVVSERFNTRSSFVPSGGLVSSLHYWEWDATVHDEEYKIRKLRKAGRHFANHHNEEHLPSSFSKSDSDSVGEEVVTKEAMEAESQHAFNSEKVITDHYHATFKMNERNEGEEGVESKSGKVGAATHAGGNPSGDSHSPVSNTAPSVSTSNIASEFSGSSTDASDLGVNARSPMETLKAIWRQLIEAPPSSTQIEKILNGAPYYTSSQRHAHLGGTATVTATSAVGDDNASSSALNSSSATITTSTSSSNTPTSMLAQFRHANPLRANGTDRESMYRQILSQFIDPLSVTAAAGAAPQQGQQQKGRAAQWLDQEFALRLKAAVVIAHQPDLWRGIGEGLKPKLVRGLRLVTPLDETVSPGPIGVSPVHNIIATALSHSVGANLAFLNLQNVEKVRDSALAVGVERSFLSKANILTALLEACEDSFVDTSRPAVVVIDDAPLWLLSNEAASEVVVEELKSVSSRVVFLAISPPDVLKSGDFSPSARPAPLPPQTSENAEISADALSNNPLASFANLFNAGNGGGGGPDSSSRTGTGTFGNSNGFFLPPGAIPPGTFFSSTGMPPSPRSSGGASAGGVPGLPTSSPMMGMPGSGSTSTSMGAMIGRSFQVVVQNGTATMIPLPPTIVPGVNNLPGGGPLSEAALSKIIQDQHRAFMQQFNGPNSNSSGISFPLFPPDMTTEEIQEFMQDPENQAKIKQTLDSVVHALSSQMAQHFGQHLGSALHQLQPPGAGGSSGGGGGGGDPNPGAPSNPSSPSNNNVEVKVHMVQMSPPGQVPFAFPPPPFVRPPKKKQDKPSSADNKTSLAVDKAAPSAIDKAKARDKAPSQSLPGAFFRGMKKRNSSDSTTTAAGSDSGANGNGKSKTSKGRAAAPSTKNKPDLNKGSEMVETEYINAFSPSGMEITTLFEDYPLGAPRDITQKALWERLLDDEVSSRILKLNRRVVSAELKRNRVRHSAGAIKALDQILRRQVMSREEVRQALRFALQLQAGKHPVLPAPPVLTAETVSASLPSSSKDEEGEGGDGASGRIGGNSPPSVTTTTADTATSVDAPSPSSPTAPPSSLVPTSQQPSSSDPQLVLSQWALDTAFSTVLKTPTPRLGRPAARSKQDISTLVTDKHERSLIGNVISPQDIGVTYDMIGGLDEVKEMLRQCITYPLKYPRLYQEGVAAEAVKGVLLFGPPGTGKTMLAKAVATEGGATFLTIDTSTIENKWLGESEKNARAVFQLARRLAPCVIYLDEVDSILSSREQGDESSHGTLTSVKTTLMQEWDGLRTTKDRVVVIASTNRPFDLDEAVLRRLPRRILVDLPDLHTRQEILSVTLANNRVDRSVNFTQLAEKLEGYTGSDIKEVCREAVVRVAHERAQMLEHGVNSVDTGAVAASGESVADVLDFNAPLRAVTLADFQAAMKKLKASVDDNGRELQKVVEWNSKYGEFKRKAKKSSGSNAHLSMYV